MKALVSTKIDEFPLIIEKLIVLIPSCGVNDQTLLQACIKAGFPDSFCKFPSGIDDAVTYMHSQLIFHVASAFNSRNDIATLRVSEKIRELVRLCLLYHAKLPNFRKFISAMLIFFGAPHRAHFTFTSLFKIVSEIWYLAGDSDTNFNYYTKRAILVKIYVLCMIHIVSDFSADFVDTMNFLDRQIQNVLSCRQNKLHITTRIRRVLNVFNVEFD